MFGLLVTVLVHHIKSLREAVSHAMAHVMRKVHKATMKTPVEVLPTHVKLPDGVSPSCLPPSPPHHPLTPTFARTLDVSVHRCFPQWPY